MTFTDPCLDFLFNFAFTGQKNVEQTHSSVGDVTIQQAACL